mmetsp:Transcript_66083/g.162657  ORF Transcript_66083/g.162657 Transcript_66083/m.162657 type:complete len:793 (-) Transcript_66083:350-2728(-)|eukprot:CAMPEP_0206234876 /NCGR_PEP_ID=MMETSP0047_2-20121206/12831_1 /ASSEMBLY_ACC=CAM_ASM_000192 /TAXON_ID=195065 /ORGANISM="Chroomonas mesostigmatica_cf, Strain CCMP1168" /LENGTH=792 /DNA_ID=CAMNT_0053659005 /DNA_START=32 /DNA_END=2410 /DNA_ORIENTATION=+
MSAAPNPYGPFSVEVSPAGQTESGVHRNAHFAKSLIAIPFPDEPQVNTVWHAFQRTVAKYGNREFLGHREYKSDGTRGVYVWQTYADVAKDVEGMGNGLVSVCGLRSGGSGQAQARVGIYSQNRPEWTKGLLAAMSQRIVIVPLYDTLGPGATTYILDHAELTCIMIERSKLGNVIAGKGKSGKLKHVVMFEDATAEEKQKAQAAGMILHSLSELIRAPSTPGAAATTPMAAAQSPTGYGQQHRGSLGGGIPPQGYLPQQGFPQGGGTPMGGYPPQGGHPPHPGMGGGSPMGYPPPQQMVWGVGGNFGHGAPPQGGGAKSGPPQPSDWAYIMYTSGTTGDPKGVILTHQNVLAPAAGLYLGTDVTKPFVNETDTYMSFLPLAHIYETNTQTCMMCAGGRIGFFAGDAANMIKEDVPLLKPTVFAAVPRIYSRMSDKVVQGIESKGFLAKFLYGKAIKSQKKKVAVGQRSKFWDKKMFSKVQAIFGGQIRVMASGAAPLSAELHNWAKSVFGCPVCQGYGMTENAGAACAMPVHMIKTGTCGGPLPCTEFKLVDTDDYKRSDVYPKTAQEFAASFSFKGTFDPKMAGKNVQRGEVCMRGPNISAGYFKNDKDTRETFVNGWLHTGDIGQWNEDGSLQIIDRKKNIFKLAQGEYVAPEAVEASVGSSKWVSQAFVYGNSFETCVVAIIVPDKDTLMPYAASKGIRGSMADVCKNQEIKKFIFDDMIACAKAVGIKGYEIPKDIAFEPEINALGQGFTIENECLTPTLKLKRPQLQKRYQGQIDAMYNKIKAGGR